MALKLFFYGKTRQFDYIVFLSNFQLYREISIEKVFFQCGQYGLHDESEPVEVNCPGAFEALIKWKVRWRLAVSDSFEPREEDGWCFVFGCIVKDGGSPSPFIGAWFVN